MSRLGDLSVERQWGHNYASLYTCIAVKDAVFAVIYGKDMP